MKKFTFILVLTLLAGTIASSTSFAQTFPSTVPSGSQVIGSGTVNGESVTVYQPDAQGPHLSDNSVGGNTNDRGAGAPPEDDNPFEDDDNDNSLPDCDADDEPVVVVYDVNVVGRDGKVMSNYQLKTNVPYRIQTIVENNSCLATNDVLTYPSGVSDAAKVSYSGGNTSGGPNTFYRNSTPEGRNGSFPVRTVVDLAASGVANVTQVVDQVGPLGRDPDIARGRDYKRVVSASAITTNRPVAEQKSRTQLASDEGGFTVSGNRATVYSPEFTLTATGAGTIRADADPNLLPNGWILPRSANQRTEDISVQTANLTLGSLLITDTSFSSANANTPRDYEYGDQVGIYWNGTNINYAGCTGKMTRTDGSPLSDFNGKRDVNGFSSTRLNLLPSNTNRDRVDLNITEPKPNQAHAYTMTCPVVGGGSITKTIRIEMGPIPVSTLVTPGITNIYAYPGETIPSIPFTIKNTTGSKIDYFRYEFDVNKSQYQYARIDPANIPANTTRTYTAQNSTFKAPTTVGTYPMNQRVYLPNYPADNYAEDTATLHVIPPKYSVTADNLTVPTNASVLPVTFTIRNTDTSVNDDDIPGYRFEVFVNGQAYRSVSRWSVLIPKDSSVDDQASNNAFKAPATAGTRANYIRVCVYTNGVTTPVCDTSDLIVTDNPFPYTVSLSDRSITLGSTLSSIPFTVRNTTAIAQTGLSYTLTVNGRAFGSGTKGDTIRASESLTTSGTGSYNPSSVGTVPMQVCVTKSGVTGQTCDNATLTVTTAVTPGNPECSDSSDNDGDSLTDRNDPGCNPGGTYDPSDDDETDGGTGPGSGVDAGITFTANPRIVRYNTATTLTYEIEAREAVTCLLSGGGLNETITVTAGATETDSITSSPLTNAQQFTLTCSAGARSSTQSVIVEVIPEAEEV